MFKKNKVDYQNNCEDIKRVLGRICNYLEVGLFFKNIINYKLYFLCLYILVGFQQDYNDRVLINIFCEIIIIMFKN